MLERLLPRHADNRFGGYRGALWLLGLLVALKLVMSINSILNTASVAAGADGIALDSFSPAAAREVLTLFALSALGQLALALVAFVVLVRYRALVPFLFLVLLGEAVARRLLVQSQAAERAASGDFGWYLNVFILAAMALGLILSLIPSREAAAGQAAE